MKADLWFLYESMLRSRLFEEAVMQLWNEGKISGEMRMSKEGMSKSFVLEHCGKPEHKEKIIYGAPYGGVQAEKLYYERGGGRRIIVEIRMDEVTNISREEE